jgi:tetratricopeptide (TPR) repeat protein/4-amino-4-deoxy-L-arabinose transferase-like glycosyltransferase
MILPAYAGLRSTVLERVARIRSQTQRLRSDYRLDLLVMLALVALNGQLLLTKPYSSTWDLTVYTDIAMNFSKGEGFILPSGYPATSMHPILYPILLAFFSKITGTLGLPMVVWPVKIFAVFTAWAIYGLGTRLFNRAAGALSALLVVSSYIFLRSYQSGYIDTVRDFLLITSLLFMMMKYERLSPWLLWAGLSMGLAFLQKETAIFWMPIPWLLFFIDWRYRRNVRLVELWTYTLLAAMPVMWWLLRSYHWAGRMDPASEKVTELAVQWGGPLLVIAVFASWLFNMLENRSDSFASCVRGLWWRRFSIMILTVAILLSSPLTALLRQRGVEASRPWQELPAYATGYSPFFPAAGLFLCIWLVGIGWAVWKGNQGAILGTLVLILGYPLLTNIAQRGLLPRNVLQIAYISCVLLAGVLFCSLNWLRHRLHRNVVWQVGYGMLIAGITGFTIWFLVQQYSAFSAFDEGARGENFNAIRIDSATVNPVADWLQENVPPGTPLMTNFWFQYTLDIHTDGDYPIFTLPMLNMRLDPEHPDQPLVREGYRVHEYYPFRPQPALLPKRGLFYLTRSNMARTYSGFFEDDIFAWIEDNRIAYVIIAGNFVFQSVSSYLDYFASHPAFELVWSAEVAPDIPVYAFRVDRTSLHSQARYPLIMSPDVMRGIFERDLPTWNLEALVDYLPRGIVLRPLENEDAELAIEIGQRYLQTGRFSSAYELFQEVNEIAPGFLSVQLLLDPQEPLDYLTQCMIHLVKGSPDTTEVCHRASVILPESPIPHFALGEVAMARRQPQQAIAHYENASELHQDSALYTRLGDAYRLSQLFEDAREAYQQAIALDPENQVAQVHLAELDAFLALSVGDESVAIEAYRRAMDLYPGYWPAASSTFQKIRQVTKFYRDIELESHSTSVYNHILFGNIFGLQGHWEQAVREYEKAIGLNSGYTLAYYGLALAYEGQDQIGQAIAVYQEAITVHPDLAWLHIYLAQVYEDQGRTQEAIAEYEEAITTSSNEMRPRFLEIAHDHIRRGRIAYEDGAYDKANIAYRLALTLSWDDQEILQTVAQACLVDEYCSEPDFLQQVITKYEEAIQKYPDRESLYGQLANVYQNVGRVDDAVSVYKRIVTHWPEKGEAYLRLGQMYEAQGDEGMAIVEYQKAVERQPELAQPYIRLASLYLAQGRTSEAITLYRASATSNPSAAWPHLQLGKIYIEQARFE